MADPRFNIWMGMGADFQGELVGYILRDEPPVNFPLITNLSESTIDLFTGIYDAGAMERLYRKWGAKDFRLWNCYITDKPLNAAMVRQDLEAMSSTYPTDFMVLGGWRYEDGRPLGTQWDDSEPPVLTGEPWWKQPMPQTLNFLPDVVVDDSDPENPVYGRPTELTDVLLMLGQPGRIFTPE